ncbi:MAG: hypothetical protein B7Z20_01740 [Sphingobium sp. 32-64-5]|nr:MAG: hypothetical protein B7Z20_01740 [Sphingobium sp. 32-64-5]
MREDISQALRITAYTYPDHRAEAAASEIMRHAFSPAYGEAWTPAQLSGFMSFPGVRLAFACVDQAHLGFSLTRHVLDEAELMLIATDPRWQNRGIGEFLLQDCINHARKSRIGTIHLEVRCNNRAIEFYLRHGFEQVHRRPAYYKGDDGTYYDALSFRLTLD